MKIQMGTLQDFDVIFLTYLKLCATHAAAQDILQKEEEIEGQEKMRKFYFGP